jgi:hypothetical protein
MPGGSGPGDGIRQRPEKRLDHDSRDGSQVTRVQRALDDVFGYAISMNGRKCYRHVFFQFYRWYTFLLSLGNYQSLEKNSPPVIPCKHSATLSLPRT